MASRTGTQFVHLFASLSLLALASCGGDPQNESNTAQKDQDEPQYLNDQGEEIFGPGYRPTSPAIDSVPLLVGRPNAGFQLPPGLRDRSQDELLSPDGTPEPADADGAAALPLLKKHSGRVVDSSALATTDSEETADGETGSDDDEDTTLPDELLDDDDPAVMTVHFVFVGQGDGAIVEFPCGVAVIDTGGEFGGGENVNGAAMFVEYLTEFFADRPQYNDTIDVLFTTHPHGDHLNGLPLLVDDNEELIFTVNNVVDNGQTADASVTGGSLFNQTDFRRAVVDAGGSFSAVEMSRQVSATGATNDVIDPFDCDAVDPVITVFWGGLNEELPADELLATSEYNTPNNHSVVIRIDFGDASFLFTGDLEDQGEEDMREQFEDNLDVFDVDVYQVSHHGADNDTSDELLDIMTPNIAVISMGSPLHDGRFNAKAHGHPRTGLLAVLQEEPGIVIDLRDTPQEFLAFPGHEQPFENTLIERAIFGTAWEGTILIEANTRGEYEIFTD